MVDGGFPHHPQQTHPPETHPPEGHRMSPSLLTTPPPGSAPPHPTPAPQHTHTQISRTSGPGGTGQHQRPLTATVFNDGAAFCWASIDGIWPWEFSLHYLFQNHVI